MVTAMKNSTPVWVNGTITAETNRDVTVQAEDRSGRRREVTLPRASLQMRHESNWIRVPQWWAYRAKLPYYPKPLAALKAENFKQGE